MTEPIIICPNCKTQIPLTDALSHQIREQVRQQMERENQETLNCARQKLEAELKKKYEEEYGFELKDLKSELEEKKRRLEEAQAKELEIRKKARELEEKFKAMDLELARKVDEERKKIEEQVALKFLEEHRLKDLEKDKIINDLKRQIDELKRKAEQGSQQAQGEVMELAVEQALRKEFPFDEIEEVSKGKKGADVIQRVRNQRGDSCGCIYWEAKNTKNWDDSWIEKLKEDQRNAGAEIAVIVSVALPKDINPFGLKNGVWITNFASLTGLACALRQILIQLKQMKTIYEGTADKKEELYRYLTSPRFSQNVEALIEAFRDMDEDLIKEREVMEKHWKNRENDIRKAKEKMIRIFADIEAISGNAVPEIKSLELKALAEKNE